jgi:phosphate transport system protein
MPMLIDISSIKADAVRMGDLAGQAISNAVKSLNDRDTDLARKVIDDDAAIDRLESEIDKKCIDALAEKLEGTRLRTVAATYRFIVDLERIGDYSVSVANVALALANKPIIGLELHVTRMAEIADGMLKRSMEAYAAETEAGLEKVFEDDLAIDRLYAKVFYDGLEEIVHEPETATNVIYLIVASRALERIGDHITDIAERVEFVRTGRLVERSVPMHVPPDPGDATWG